MDERTKIIKKIWKDIHDNFDSLFYWSNGTTTLYYYDEKYNIIRSDNGFCVLVEKSNNELNSDYIESLIDKLEWIIILYYRYVLNIELYEYD